MRRGWIRRTALAVALAVPSAVPAALLEADEASGFFALRPQLPGRIPFLVPRFLGGDVPDPGRSRWRTDLLYTSTLQYTRGIIVSERPDPDLASIVDYMNEVVFWTGKTLHYFDGETARMDIGWFRGMPGGWELGIELPVVHHGGGFLDGTVSRFHGSAGLSDAGRDSAPVDAGAIILMTPEGRVELMGQDLPASEPGDLTVSARFPLPSRSPRFRAELGGMVELPTGDPDTMAGSGGIDFAASASLRWSFARQRLRMGLGYARLGGLAAIPGLAISHTHTASVAYEVRVSPRTSLLTQLLHSSSPYESLGVDGLSDPAVLFAIGPRVAMGRHWVLDLALVEDAARHNADLDLGILMSLEWHPGGASRSTSSAPPTP